MSLSDLAALGSFVSALAVLFSLAFLGLQARYMIRNQQSLVHLGRTQVINDNFATVSSPELIEIVLKGNRGDGELTAGEHFFYGNNCWNTLTLHENSFLQHRAGLLTDEQFDAALGMLKWQCVMPGFRAFWVQSRPLFEKHFAAFVDEFMDRYPAVSDPMNTAYQTWKRQAAKQLASAQPDLRGIQF